MFLSKVSLGKSFEAHKFLRANCGFVIMTFVAFFSLGCILHSCLGNNGRKMHECIHGCTDWADWHHGGNIETEWIPGLLTLHSLQYFSPGNILEPNVQPPFLRPFFSLSLTSSQVLYYLEALTNGWYWRKGHNLRKSWLHWLHFNYEKVHVHWHWRISFVAWRTDILLLRERKTAP